MNKKNILLMICCLLSCIAGIAQKPSDTPVSQMEKLNRGLVVMPTTSGKVFISWRLLGTDKNQTSFELLKNGKSLKKNILTATSLNASGTATDAFQIVTYQNGVPVDTTKEVMPWTQSFLQIKLNRPEKVDGKAYFPNDCSTGDVDGDGEYEIILKWDPENSKDNASSGYTNPVIFDCYKLDGTQLWRINLGINCRAGAHYTQFMVYDFDGDGKAEMICKTAPGSKDGLGNYVNKAATDTQISSSDNTADYRDNGSVDKGTGHILSGPEYLTVFEGATGKAIHTTWYNPNRAGNFNRSDKHPAKSFWNDAYGNRGDRHLACVAYLDGPDKNPSAVMVRGYYTRAYLWAVDFDGSELKHKWLHASVNNKTVELYDANWNKTTKTYNSNTSGVGSYYTMFGNGNHNLSVGDVDGDGCDEIIWGSGAVDHDGSLLYSVGFGHGDAIHLADLDPDRPGYEVFDVHEESVGSYGADLHDARTGEVLVRKTRDRDTGRGIAADFDPDYRGCEFTFATQLDAFKINGTSIYSSNPGMNFRIFWDGDEYEEMLDDVTINKWSKGSANPLGLGFSRGSLASFGNPASCNGTKATPCLTADLFGDWREEVVYWSKTDSATLNVYTSAYSTNYRVPTLMHDHVYRMGICWQNVAYNQPPHLGYYLPDYIESFQGVDPTGIKELKNNTELKDNQLYFNLQGQRIEKPLHGIYIRNGKKYFAK